MKNLRRSFDRFCFENRNKGIPNLMLYVTLGTAIVYILTMVLGNYSLYSLLCFDRDAILHGQVWRLISYSLTSLNGNPILMLVMLVCYYSLGTAMERSWGTFRFNLFYFTGIILSDLFALIFDCQASAAYLNMSLFLGYATMYPQATFLMMFIIPVKAWVLALFDLAIILFGVVSSFNLFPLVSLANYFLFFGKDVLNVIPLTWQVNFRRLFRKKKAAPKVIPFPAAGSYQASAAAPKAPYTHRCTVCGRTDVSDPGLEFRYCSKCNGYYCYCSDHISNHTHIQ